MERAYSISEVTDDDVPAVVALCRAALDLPEDAAEAAEIVLRLRETTGTDGWTGKPRRLVGFVATTPASDPATPATQPAGPTGPTGPAGATGGGRLVGVALGSVSHRDASVGHLDLVAVHPAERRRGICRALVTRLEGALAGLGAAEVVLAGNPPYYAWPGIDVRYTPAVCAAMALGFEQDQVAWNMTAELTGDNPAGLRPTASAERRLAGEGVTVRRAARRDVPDLVDFALANFGSGWAGEITHSVGRAGVGVHVALDADGTILGFAAYGSSRPSWFGPMGTAPAAQGRGIGGVLLRRCLTEMHAAGRGSVQIGWVGPMPFYSGVAAARVERVFFLYRKQL